MQNKKFSIAQTFKNIQRLFAPLRLCASAIRLLKYPVIILIPYLSIISLSAQSPKIIEVDCPYFMQSLANETATDIACGYLFAPENRMDADSPDVELFYVIIYAENDSGNAPVINLEGGPGGAASYAFASWLESGLHADYDIILIDQRGTGLSYISLDCPEAYEEYDYLLPCRERLENNGVDLDAYNSANNAADIHDLILTLRLPQVNIYGSSYGTRLALTLLRDHPENIRSMIIDAVFPPHINFLHGQAYYANQAFEQLFNDCANSIPCNDAYPNLRQIFYDTVQYLDHKPAQKYDEEYDEMIEMSGKDFVNELFSLFYDSTMLPYLPAIIYATYEGDYEYDPLFEAESGEYGEGDEFDLAALDYLEIDNLDDLYDYYDDLSDSEYDDLYYEIEDYMAYLPYIDYLGVENIDEVYEYLDSLSDEEFYELDAEVTGTYDDDSEGMYYSVECVEETPFNTANAIREHSAGLPQVMYDALVEDIVLEIEDCAIWDVTMASELENLPVLSEIPTLIFSGSYDPITPKQWGDEAGKYLSHSWHYVFPNVGHGALDSFECPTDIALQFLVNPSLEPDASCLASMSAPDFYIRP